MTFLNGKKAGIILALMTWLIIPTLLAHESIPVTTQELTRRSEKIVVGTVVNQFSAWDEYGREIYTYITLKVEEQVKSIRPDSIITIRQLGGKVGNVESQVLGLPGFSIGERVLVFLGPFSDRRFYGLIDWNAGKYSIQAGKGTRQTLQGTGPAHGNSLENFVKELRSYL